MKRIPTKVHGVMDYAGGLLLIAAPWLFGFNDDPAASRIAIVIGIVMLAQSLITDYEVSFARVIPMRAHLAMDAIAGLLLIASPWLFGFADEVWVPHVLLGALELGAAAMTETEPSGRRAQARTAVTAR